MKKFCLPIQNTSRHITVDNWFSSVPLMNHILSRYKISMVGTAGKGLPQLPKYFTEKKKPEMSVFAYDDTKILVSYMSDVKNPKVVLQMSTLKHMNKSADSKTKKYIYDVF